MVPTKDLRVKYVPHRRPQGGVVSLRDSIAATIDGTDSARDVAALAKRLMEVMEAIDALPDPEAEASPLDAAKRKRGGA